MRPSGITACLLTSLLLGSSGDALPIQASYQISASGFMDSNSSPPLQPASTSVTGTYTFSFDDSIASQTNIVPDSVVGLQIMDSNGSVIGFDETDSGVDAQVNTALDRVIFTIGGLANGITFMQGGTDDFRIGFIASLSTLEVLSVTDFGTLGFVTSTDPLYTGPAAVSLVVIPEPTTLSLLSLGLLGLAGGRRRALRNRNLPSRRRSDAKSAFRPAIRG